MDIIKIVKKHYLNKGYKEYAHLQGIGIGYLVFDKATAQFTVCHTYREFPKNLLPICKLNEL